jgi:hypothetical protein
MVSVTNAATPVQQKTDGEGGTACSAAHRVQKTDSEGGSAGRAAQTTAAPCP